MYLPVNVAFVNYFDKALEGLGVPNLRNWTTQEQVLPFSVESFEINASLQNASKTLKECVCQYKNRKELTDKQECTHEERTKQSSKFGSFLNSVFGRYTSFLSCTVNNDYNISSNLYGMWTIKN